MAKEKPRKTGRGEALTKREQIAGRKEEGRKEMYLESVWGRAMVKGCGKDGEGRGEIGRVKVGGGGGGGRRHSGGWRQWGCALRIYSRQHIHHGGFSWTRNALPWIYICFHPHHRSTVPPSSPRSPPHPNFDPIPSPVYPVFWQNLSFSMTCRLFSSILPPPARQKENNRRCSTFMSTYSSERRYSRVTHAVVNARSFPSRSWGIVVKTLANIFPTPTIQRIDETLSIPVCFAIRKWLISGETI